MEQPSRQLPEDITSLMYWHHKFFTSRSYAISLLYFSLPSLIMHMYLGIAVWLQHTKDKYTIYSLPISLYSVNIELPLKERVIAVNLLQEHYTKYATA